MVLKTKHFGNVEINEEDIIAFEKGMPGFESNKRFVILHKIEEDNPFKWLQSVDDGKVAFVVINPQVFKDHYEVKIDQAASEELDIQDMKDIIVYSIVTIPEEVSKMTANLKAPVIINAKKNKGCQIILEDERYEFRHLLLDEFKKMGGK
ncbi:MAG: flagellar assembly protein FliW [Deltaproteobacteria bacterium]